LVNQLVWVYLLVTNAAGFFLMGFDKLGAILKSERVPEIWFVMISVVGGFAGVMLGMSVFHHKTSKTSFQIKIVIAASLGAIAVVLFAVQF
jgi:uncharacterized membrane protein YsdA (DUF1294 family)